MCNLKFILFFITSLAVGQTPFSKENTNNTIALKAVAYPNLLQGGYGSIIGIEKGFLRNNSIGAKFIYNYFTPHTEDKNGDGIDYSIEKDISYIIEYKHYLNFENFRERSGVSLYTSLSYKFGNKKIDNDFDYPHDFYHQKIEYYFYGPGFGTTIVLDKSKRWTIDTQLSFLFGRKDFNTTYENPVKHDFKESYNSKYLRFEIMIAYNLNWK
jgi:hypothetical protein